MQIENEQDKTKSYYALFIFSWEYFAVYFLVLLLQQNVLQNMNLKIKPLKSDFDFLM